MFLCSFVQHALIGIIDFGAFFTVSIIPFRNIPQAVALFDFVSLFLLGVIYPFLCFCLFCRSFFLGVRLRVFLYGY